MKFVEKSSFDMPIEMPRLQSCTKSTQPCLVIRGVVKKLDFIKLEKMKSNFFQTNYVIKLEKTK